MNDVVSGGAIARGPGEGQTVPNPAGGPLTYKARADQTDGALTVWESIAEPNEGPPLHVHLREDEFIYVLDGRLRIQLEADLFDAPAGSFVLVPKGLPHTWQNVGAGPVRILFGFVPASAAMERFFERAAELPEATRMADAFQELAADAGMEVVGPPLARSHPSS